MSQRETVKCANTDGNHGMFDIIAQAVARAGKLDDETYQMTVPVAIVGEMICSQFQLQKHELDAEKISESIAANCNVTNDGWVSASSLIQLLQYFHAPVIEQGHSLQRVRQVHSVCATVQQLTTRNAFLERECSRLQELYNTSEIEREHAIQQLEEVQSRLNSQIEYRATVVSQYEVEHDRIVRERNLFETQRHNFRNAIDREVDNGVKREAILQSCCRELARLKQKNRKYNENLYAANSRYNSLLKEHRNVKELKRVAEEKFASIQTRNQSLLQTMQRRLDENNIWKERVVDLELQLGKVLQDLETTESNNCTFVLDLDSIIIGDNSTSAAATWETQTKDEEANNDHEYKKDEETVQTSESSKVKGKPTTTRSKIKRLVSKRHDGSSKRNTTKICPPGTSDIHKNGKLAATWRSNSPVPKSETDKPNEKSRTVKAFRKAGKFVGIVTTTKK